MTSYSRVGLTVGISLDFRYIDDVTLAAARTFRSLLIAHGHADRCRVRLPACLLLTLYIGTMALLWNAVFLLGDWDRHTDEQLRLMPHFSSECRRSSHEFRAQSHDDELSKTVDVVPCVDPIYGTPWRISRRPPSRTRDTVSPRTRRCRKYLWTTSPRWNF